MIIRGKKYQLSEEKFCNVVRMIDGFPNIGKEIFGEEVVYSAPKLKPGDFKVYPIIDGTIELNHERNIIYFSSNLIFGSEIEEKILEAVA